MAFAKVNCSPEQMAVVGYRLYTNIRAGKNAGRISILVLSGETKRSDLAASAVIPDYVFENIGELAAALSAGDQCGGENLKHIHTRD